MERNYMFEKSSLTRELQLRTMPLPKHEFVLHLWGDELSSHAGAFSGQLLK